MCNFSASIPGGSICFGHPANFEAESGCSNLLEGTLSETFMNVYFTKYSREKSEVGG